MSFLTTDTKTKRFSIHFYNKKTYTPHLTLTTHIHIHIHMYTRRKHLYTAHCVMYVYVNMCCIRLFRV